MHAASILAANKQREQHAKKAYCVYYNILLKEFLPLFAILTIYIYFIYKISVFIHPFGRFENGWSKETINSWQ
jgi:hypothetical protein